MVEEKITIYSNKLANLTRRCPSCGTSMTATGKMHYEPIMSEWFIEYWCPAEEQTFDIYAPETDQLVAEIQKDSSRLGQQ